MTTSKKKRQRRKRYIANKDKILEQEKKRYANKREKILLLRKARYNQCKRAENISTKAYYNEHKDAIKDARKAKNMPALASKNILQREKYQASPDKKRIANRKAAKVKYWSHPQKNRLYAKARYDMNPVPKRLANRVAAKARYDVNPVPKRLANRVAAKARYDVNPFPKRLASRVAAKARYDANPNAKRAACREAYRMSINRNDMKQTLAKAARNRYHKYAQKKTIAMTAYYAKKRGSVPAQYRCKCLYEPKEHLIRHYIVELKKKIISESKVKREVRLAFNGSYKGAQQTKSVTKTACCIASKQLVNRVLMMRKLATTSLLSSVRKVKALHITAEDIGEQLHSGNSEPYFMTQLILHISTIV